MVTVQLETNDGNVLGSTRFVYKDEICTGFQKIACSINYGGEFIQAFCNRGSKKGPATSNQPETNRGKD